MTHQIRPAAVAPLAPLAPTVGSAQPRPRRSVRHVGVHLRRALVGVAALAAGAAAGGAPPVRARPTVRARPAAELTRGSLVTAGLADPQLFRSLYAGDFEQVRLERDDPLLGALFYHYLVACANRCAETLPADKVEMTEPECVGWFVPRNKWGVQVGPEACVRYEPRATGLYADPVLLDAYVQFQNEARPSMMRTVMGGVLRNGPVGGTVALADKAATMTRDVDALLAANGCASPPVRRFQDNLRLFTLNRQPIRIDGAGGASAATREPQAAARGPAGESDYARLLDDLITEQSKSWAMNRYVGGSVSGVGVLSRDPVGRPVRLSGQYEFVFLDGKRNAGSVTLDFADGVPSCLYFFDLPAECRAANRRVASAYVNGAYRR